MTSNEELVKQYQNGDKSALEQLINQNKKFVFKIANRYYTEGSNSLDKEDLLQEGYIGLIKAAEKYNAANEANVKFITYAAHWIKQKISRFIHKRSTVSEFSLDTPIDNEESKTHADILVGETGEDYIEAIEVKELQEKVRELMRDNLTTEEQEVLKCIYGFYGFELTLESTAEVMGYTVSAKREKVRGIEVRSLRKLRNTPYGKQYISERLKEELLKEKRTTEAEALRRIKLQEKFQELEEYIRMYNIAV